MLFLPHFPQRGLAACSPGDAELTWGQVSRDWPTPNPKLPPRVLVVTPEPSAPKLSSLLGEFGGPALRTGRKVSAGTEPVTAPAELPPPGASRANPVQPMEGRPAEQCR